jgi:hypothetical protein
LHHKKQLTDDIKKYCYNIICIPEKAKLKWVTKWKRIEFMTENETSEASKKFGGRVQI